LPKFIAAASDRAPVVSGAGRTQVVSGFLWQSAAIFLVALALRAFHLWQLRRSPFATVLLGDSRAYDSWAQRIASGEWIGQDVFYQAPLYPYFLGTVYAIAGHHLQIARVVQAIIGSASCVLLARAARLLFSNRTGVIAGLMLAFYGPAIFFDALIQKSVLDVFFVCASLCLIAKIVVRLQPGLNLWLLLGLTIGALSLTRENAIVFTFVLAVWALGRTPRGAAVFLAAMAIVILPVALRNSILGGGLYVTTSQFGPNFYIGNNERADGSYQSLRFGRGAPEYERQDATEIAERARGRKLTAGEVSSYWFDRAADFITSNPGAWLKLAGRKIALIGNATEMLDTESQESHAEWSDVLRLTSPFAHFGVLVPLAVLGFIVTWPMRQRLAIVSWTLGTYALSVVAFYVFARYRFPLVPFLILFAAAAVSWAIRPDSLSLSIREHAGRRMAGPLAAAAAAAVATNWPLVPAALNRAVTEQNLGAALQLDGRLDEAIAHYRRAIDVQPDYAPAYNNLGSALRASGRLDDAVVAYERALQLRPSDFPDAHYNLANALLDEGRSSAAQEHFHIALQSMPASADVHNNLGIALSAEGRLDEAVGEFRRAVDIEPGSAKAHRNLGDALVSAGSAREGLDHLRRAAQLAPTDATIQYDLGSALLEAGELDQAVAALGAALRLAPDYAEAHNNLGIALGSAGRLDAAIGEFQAALKIKPDFIDARRNLAMAMRARKP
jgi:tetratricopeptide (TPR) repeat protein